MKSVNYLLDKISNSFQVILQENILRIYLHGSLVMNDFNEQSSNINFLVVIKNEINNGNMREGIDVLLLNLWILYKKKLIILKNVKKTSIR